MGSVAVRRIVIGRSAGALLCALAAGAVSLISPPAAILILGVLAARALMHANAPRINWLSLAGPAFGCVLVGAFVGLAGAIGFLFAWRVIADARWSVGEAQRLSLAAGRPGETGFTAIAHAWATPIYGLALVAFTAPHMVAGLPLDLPHVAAIAPLAFGFVAAALVFDWALRRAADWRLGELAAAPAAHLLGHHLVFGLAFGLTLDLSAGIVALIAWRLAHAAPLSAQPSFTAVP
ncbi:MAG: hypothetical protein AB7P07_09190 [Hyphomonadaceae bacterium]